MPGGKQTQVLYTVGMAEQCNRLHSMYDLVNFYVTRQGCTAEAWCLDYKRQ